MSKENKLSLAEIGVLFGIVAGLAAANWCVVSEMKTDLKEDIAVVSLQLDNLDTKFEDHLKYHKKDTCDDKDNQPKEMSYTTKGDELCNQRNPLDRRRNLMVRDLMVLDLEPAEVKVIVRNLPEGENNGR